VRLIFRQWATRLAELVGSPWAFVTGVGLTIIWALTGPYFRYSDAWQLVINTGTSVITFLMVFLIQNMQNRDAKAMHLKLDELIRAVASARNHLVNLESLSDEELDKLQEEFTKLREATEKRKAGK
jgi:low affinity Fe/Cu permease